MWSEASCTAGQRLNRRYCNYILLLQDLQEAELTVAVVIHPEETQQSYKPVVRTLMHKQRSMDDVKVCDCLCVCVCVCVKHTSKTSIIAFIGASPLSLFCRISLYCFILVALCCTHLSPLSTYTVISNQSLIIITFALVTPAKKGKRAGNCYERNGKVTYESTLSRKLTELTD